MADSVPVRPSRYKAVNVYDHEHVHVDVDVNVNVIVAVVGCQTATVDGRSPFPMSLRKSVQQNSTLLGTDSMANSVPMTLCGPEAVDVHDRDHDHKPTVARPQPKKSRSRPRARPRLRRRNVDAGPALACGALPWVSHRYVRARSVSDGSRQRK